MIEALTVLGFIAAFLIIFVDTDVPMGLRVVGCVIAGAVVGALSRAALKRLERAQPTRLGD